MNNSPMPYKGSIEKVAVATPTPSTIRESVVHGKILQYKQEQSSLVGQARRGGLSSSNFDRIFPRVPFWKRMEYYLTVGRVQNVVESYVLDIINREWYYDDTTEGAHEKAVQVMEDWEENILLSKLLSELTRNWIVNGVNIISPIDWEFVQLQSIQAKRRDNFGNTTHYIQIINGQEIDLPAKDFLEIPFIELDREPWGVGMFDSLMNREYIDIDGRDVRASLELYRQALQDNMKIHHKFASPRVIYTVPNANEETIDNDIVPIIENMVPGDRAVFNEDIGIQQETVDGNARFIEHVNKIIDEIDTGLQSSANRLIAEPSAMADARVASSNDDDRTLGIMERIRIFMNRTVIPSVTGLEPGVLVFKWGAKDAFDLEFPEPLQAAVEKKVISPEAAAIILEDQYHWKIPTPDDIEDKFGIRPADDNDTTETPGEDKTDASSGEERPIQTAGGGESVKTEKLDRDVKNEKLVALHYLNEKLGKLK